MNVYYLEDHGHWQDSSCPSPDPRELVVLNPKAFSLHLWLVFDAVALMVVIEDHEEGSLHCLERLLEWNSRRYCSFSLLWLLLG